MIFDKKTLKNRKKITSKKSDSIKNDYPRKIVYYALDCLIKEFTLPRGSEVLQAILVDNEIQVGISIFSNEKRREKIKFMLKNGGSIVDEPLTFLNAVYNRNNDHIIWNIFYKYIE